MKTEVRIVEKPWGREEIVEVNEKYVVKKLLMKKGQRCSLQYHKIKKETVMVLEGQLGVLLNDKEFFLNPFEFVTISPGEVHRMFATENDCLYMESSTPELDDVVRLSDDYKR
jgi:mannose-6-phosphate isomerase